jgi:hypothetical protein
VVVTAASGLRIGARFVVVTGGIGTFSPRRLPSLRAFEGKTAVRNAAVALDPSASLFPGHSTDAEAARP